jgi:hypothetical protein
MLNREFKGRGGGGGGRERRRKETKAVNQAKTKKLESLPSIPRIFAFKQTKPDNHKNGNGKQPGSTDGYYLESISKKSHQSRIRSRVK